MRPRLIAARLLFAFALAGSVTGCAMELGNPWFLAQPDVPGDPDAPTWPSDQPVGLRRDGGGERDGQLEADVPDASPPADGGVAPADSPDAGAQDVGPEDVPVAADVPPAPEDRPPLADVVDASDAPDAGAPMPDVVVPQDAGTRDVPADLSPDVPDTADAPDATDATDARDVGVDAGAEDRPRPDVVDVPVTCAPGTEWCGTSCADVRTSVEHCGVCGRACGAGEVCTDGRCHDVPCGAVAGWYLCGGACVDVARNDDHCGRCSSPCGAGFHCRSGLCGG